MNSRPLLILTLSLLCSNIYAKKSLLVFDRLNDTQPVEIDKSFEEKTIDTFQDGFEITTNQDIDIVEDTHCSNIIREGKISDNVREVDLKDDNEFELELTNRSFIHAQGCMVCINQTSKERVTIPSETTFQAEKIVSEVKHWRGTPEEEHDALKDKDQHLYLFLFQKYSNNKILHHSRVSIKFEGFKNNLNAYLLCSQRQKQQHTIGQLRRILGDTMELDITLNKNYLELEPK